MGNGDGWDRKLVMRSAVLELFRGFKKVKKTINWGRSVFLWHNLKTKYNERVKHVKYKG